MKPWPFPKRDHSAVEPFDHAGVGAVAVEADGDGCKSLSLDRPQIRQRDIGELDLRALSERLDQDLIGETVAVPVQSRSKKLGFRSKELGWSIVGA